MINEISYDAEIETDEERDRCAADTRKGRCLLG